VVYYSLCFSAWVDRVFNEFSGRFYGKTCPVQLYWHHMDLAVTRFSGKRAPKMDPSARISTDEGNFNLRLKKTTKLAPGGGHSMWIRPVK
jgi:hypothetical protein